VLTKNKMLGYFCIFPVGQYYAYCDWAELTHIVLKTSFWLLLFIL